VPLSDKKKNAQSEPAISQYDLHFPSLHGVFRSLAVSHTTTDSPGQVSKLLEV